MQISKIKALATRYGWEEILPRKNPAMVSFARENERINVFHTTGTVAVITNDFEGKRTQSFRRNIDLKELDGIFNRPRHSQIELEYKGEKEIAELIAGIDDLKDKVVNLMIMRSIFLFLVSFLVGIALYNLFK